MDIPKLEVLTGPLKGASFSLPLGDVPVGREDDNVIRISHPSVSRHHCLFLRQPDGTVLVRDLGSRNGTLVNGKMVNPERRLQFGDEIHVGTSLFVLNPKPGSRTSTASNNAISLNGNASRFLTGNTVDSAPVTAQIVRFLDALLKASSTLGAAANQEDWESILLNSAFALTSATRAAVAPPEISPQFSDSVIQGVAAGEQDTRINLEIELRVIQQSLARNAAIINRANNTAVMVAPIRSATRVGFLYLEGPTFSEDELHAISAIATLGALAWERVDRLAQLEAENQRLWSNIEHDLIGSSKPIESLLSFISKVAPVDSNVLLLGESGTGKDLVAKAIHRNSPRSSKPYIAINCGAIPETLIESELFGVERGAFTGASALRKGLFEAASGGTVFLDEISELKLSVQPTLLRVLQDREVRRVGGSKSIPLDFRLIVASNRNLDEMVQEGRFRADLYHRLAVVSKMLPTLRERRDDIPLLANHFVRKFAERSRPVCQGMSKAALNLLVTYNWPGNVRELKNAMERAVALGSGELIEIDDLPESITEHGGHDSDVTGFHESVAQLRRNLVQDALERSNGSFVEAARILKIHPNYLHRLVTNLRLRSDADPEKSD